MKSRFKLATRVGAASWILLAGVCVAAPEVPPSGWLTAGSATATPYYVKTAKAEGPTVFIVGGMHGNEPAGAAAAEQVRNWPICRGRIVVVPRANAVALAANTRTLKLPGGTNRYDLNRAFPPKTGATHPGAELAQELWALVRTNQPDWLLDLHEGGDFRAQTNSSVGSSIIPSLSPEARRLGELLVKAVNSTMPGTSRHFVLLKQPIQGSLARAVADQLRMNALIVETTSKSQPLALRIRQHRIAVHALLHELGMLDPTVTPAWMTGNPAQSDGIKVAVYDGAGNSGAGVLKVLAQVGAATHATITRLCPEDIRAGALQQFDVVVFSGGSGSGQSKALGEEGCSKVRRFIEAGGGYVGICAGAYLACSGFSWGLDVIDAKTRSPFWQRGKGMVKLELTAQGRAIFGERRGQFDCLYNQGPIVEPAEVEAVPDFDTLAFFRSEVAQNDTPRGIMVNSPAIFGGSCGKGRVLCFSPHPEQTQGLETFLPRAVAWVASRQSETAARR